ncbi:MAG: CDP-diacylglycerol--serine O-phosphatidyltransferase [Anaerolineae bacterium]|nr:CDP-diacylglycerol--serine O-phosphatidyltransferase [Anaerolineae bacterium]
MRSIRIPKFFIPSAVTAASILLGYLAILSALHDYFVTAAWLLLLIALLDSVDGRLARALDATSDFGAQLDSLADLLNFGVALSILFYRAFFVDWGLIGMVLSFMPTLFSALRLARFNVENEDNAVKAPYFTGLPTTLSAMLLASFVIFAGEMWTLNAPHLIPAVLVLLVSFLMVSEVPYATNATLLSGLRVKNSKKVVALIFLISLLALPAKAFFMWTIAFVLLGFVRSVYETLTDRS